MTGRALDDIRLNPSATGPRTPAAGGRQRQIIVVAPFADGWQVTNQCGMQKRADGTDTVSALCCPSDHAARIATFLEVAGPPEPNDPAVRDPAAPVPQPR
jgi:hypothetical protein